MPDNRALTFHAIAGAFPLIEGPDFDELVADVRAHGVREPIVLLDGQILDGRNRYRAAQAAGVECPMRDYDGDDPVGFVVSLNLRRRHLNEGQRAWAAGQIARLEQGDRSIDRSFPTQGEAAAMLNISESSVRRAAVVRDHGVPELQELVARGEAAPSTAAAVARLPEEEQRAVVGSGERLAGALRQKLELDRTPKEMRDNMDPKSRAMNDWLPVIDGVVRLRARIEMKPLPQLPASLKDELAERWEPVARFISINLEQA